MLTDTALFSILIVVLAFVMLTALERVGYQFSIIDKVLVPLSGVAVFLISVGVTAFINSLF